MKLNDGSRRYLENYYLLEQTRTEAHQYLEEIAASFSTLVEEYLDRNGNTYMQPGKWLQKGGGYVEFIFERSEPIESIENIDRWKYMIVYKDAMRSNDLFDSTKCRVYGFSPKLNAKQIQEVRRMAAKLNLPDPYRQVEIDILNTPSEEAVEKITQTCIDFYDNFIKVIDGLVAEQE